MAANRIGKSEGVGAYETTLHLTGQYPYWWEGRRFNYGINAWAAGKDSKTTREIVQLKLLGRTGDFGTGMIPADCIIATTPKPGVPEGIESIVVRHTSGTKSRIVLKSYDQGRESFQGTELEVIWLDEECDLDLYLECLTRTMTTQGLTICTFTPLLGMSALARYFLDIKPAET